MVKDEFKELKNCLRAFKPLAKEILLLDTGSNQKIKALAVEFGVKRFAFKWIDDFATARNEIISKAQGDWIMMVDADDFIEKASNKKLKKYLQALPLKTEVISLPYIYNKFEGKTGNLAYLPRLWKRSLKLKYIYPIHEYLDLSDLDNEKVAYLDIPIIHNKAQGDFTKSFERNLKLIKKYLEEKPEDLRMLYYLVHDSQQIKDHETVIWGAQKYLEANPINTVKLFKVLIRKGKAHAQLKQTLQAQEAFLLAMSINPLLIESYLELGNLYKNQNLFPEAEHFYRCAMLCKKPKEGNDFHNQALYDGFPMRQLSFLLSNMGKNEEALKYAREVFKSHPEDNKLKTYIETLNSKL